VVFVGVLLPNLMLVAVLALARYEEFMLGGGESAREPRERHPALTTGTGLGALAAAAPAVRRYRESPRAGARFPLRTPW
jgi:hypothetical protein